MACGCQGGSTAAKSSWKVDLTMTGKTFPDGSSVKTYALATEALAAIAQLGLTGSLRPVPA